MPGRISIGEGRSHACPAVFQPTSHKVGERQGRITDASTTRRRCVLPLPVAHADVDRIGAFFRVGMAATDGKGLPTLVHRPGCRTGAITPVDAGRERATAGVRAAGYCSSKSTALGGVHSGAVETERDVVRLVGSHIAAGLVVIWTAVAALVGDRTEVGAGRDHINGRTALLQGDGLGRPAVIL